MIPLFATIRIHRLNLWLPLFLAWLLLLPLVLIGLPFFVVACLCFGLNPFRALGILLEILSALRGVRIEVSDPGFSRLPGKSILIEIR